MEFNMDELKRIFKKTEKIIGSSEDQQAIWLSATIHLLIKSLCTQQGYEDPYTWIESEEENGS